MTPTQKYTIATAAFYAIGFALIPVFGRYFHSGPCTPDLDTLFPLFMLVATFVIFVIFFAGRVKGGRKEFTGAAIISGLVLLGFSVYLYFN